MASTKGYAFYLTKVTATLKMEIRHINKVKM